MDMEAEERSFTPALPWRPLVEEEPWGLFSPLAALSRALWAPRTFPAVDVVERPEEVVVQAELPGIDPDQVDIEVENHSLRLRGEIRKETERQEGGLWRSERRYGAFVRHISLPADVDPERATASYRHGVLEIRLPKKEGAHRRIPVQRQG